MSEMENHLLIKIFSKLVCHVANLNLDQGVFTNGFLIRQFKNELLDNFTYVRVSARCRLKKIHSKLHDAPSHHFQKNN